MATNRDPRDRREKHRRLSDVPPPASPPPGSGVEDESGPLARRGFLGWVAGVTVVVTLMAVAAWTLAGWNADRDRTQALNELSDQAAGVHDLVSGLPPLDAESFRAPPDGRERARLARALLGARDAGVHVLTLWRGDVAVYSSDAAIDGRRVAAERQSAPRTARQPERRRGRGRSALLPAGRRRRRAHARSARDLELGRCARVRPARGPQLDLPDVRPGHRRAAARAGAGRDAAWRRGQAPGRGGGDRGRYARSAGGSSGASSSCTTSPSFELETGQPVAVEALLRWRRRGELLCPAQFLPDAEASAAIGPLTDHVLDLALEQAGAWQRAGRQIGVSVNLSAANLRDAGLAARLEGLLAEHDVTPQHDHARGDRDRGAGGARADPRRARRDRGPGRVALGRRLRDGLLVPPVAEAVPGHGGQDRPELRLPDADRRAGLRVGRHPPGPRPRAVRGGRGRRGPGDAREPPGARVRHRAGIPVLPSGAARRGGGVARPRGGPGLGSRSATSCTCAPTTAPSARPGSSCTTPPPISASTTRRSGTWRWPPPRPWPTPSSTRPWPRTG